MEHSTSDQEFGDVLILGADGLLGHALQLVIPHAIALGRDMDITNRDRIAALLERVRPAIVLNAAAITGEGACEKDPERAMLVNGAAPGHLADACARVDAVLVHYSCPDVFDGTKEDCAENEPLRPRNIYGTSKAEGELRVMSGTEDYRIIRTSWIFGPYGTHFVDELFALSSAMKNVPVPDNEFGSPTFSIDLALATTGIILANPGIYHLTNSGVASRYDVARCIIPNAVPVKTKEPLYSTLASTLTEPLRPWTEALEDYLRVRGGAL
ncbi:MAG: NAD(P)-dependent oxidoreductase [Methanomicrobiales archaeon]|nr:NAD(P)-dependent oxidoreductase [Methanomicrobiales archaeon]